VSDLLIQGLHIDMQPKAKELVRRARLEGLNVLIPKDGGARTATEQMIQYAKGRHHDSTGRWVFDDPAHHAGVVTNALPADSPHCHRAGVDVAIVERGAMLTLASDLDPKEKARQLALYCQLGQIGEDLGLIWGGRWVHIHDYDHFELPNWRSLPVQP
jgi:hypothetical protein